jgi:hypothetical protein
LCSSLCLFLFFVVLFCCCCCVVFVVFLARGFCPYAGVVSSLHWSVWIVEVELYIVFFHQKKEKRKKKLYRFEPYIFTGTNYKKYYYMSSNILKMLNKNNLIPLIIYIYIYMRKLKNEIC